MNNPKDWFDEVPEFTKSQILRFVKKNHWNSVVNPFAYFSGSHNFQVQKVKGHQIRCFTYAPPISYKREEAIHRLRLRFVHQNYYVSDGTIINELVFCEPKDFQKMVRFYKPQMPKRNILRDLWESFEIVIRLPRLRKKISPEKTVDNELGITNNPPVPFLDGAIFYDR